MPNKKSFSAKNDKKEEKGPQKRKRSSKSTLKDAKPKRNKYEEEDITSESENEELIKEMETEESDQETADEKRNRLTKQMLEEIKEGRDDDEVNTYLKEQVLDECGKLFHTVADKYVCPAKEEIKFCTWSELGVVTCVVVSSDNKFIISGCKNGHIVKWSLPDYKKVSVIKRVKTNEDGRIGHKKEVRCLALSRDNKFLVSGGDEEFIYVWDPEKMKHLHTFRGHRFMITSLCFQAGTHMLYSGSKDKSIKRWNLDQMAYAETLFGHEDTVMSLDCLATERALSCGGRDHSIRFWKVPEESHLLFGGKLDNIDCVKFIDNSHFLSASSDNKLTVWSTDSKRYKSVVIAAHGNSEQWISSIATLKQCDMFASGSFDGYLKLWKVSADFRSIEILFSIELDGYLNSLQFSEDGEYIVAGIGKEHRLGRWFESIKTVKNSVAIIKLNRKKSTVTNGEECQ